MRGQAFVVFEEISAATAAMRALVGEEFYGRPLVSVDVLFLYFPFLSVCLELLSRRSPERLV